ncbi:hypothetical protein JCM24511_01874 [Saitozyma sp. JCM 24511]|nr:hypothetical protein JCM24511_01874 [Saitozyma sp. JCM 24511]
MSVSTLSDSDDDLHSIPANATQLDSSDTNSTSPSSSRDYFVSLDSTDDTRPPATTSPGDLSRASSVAASIIPASTGPPTTFEALLPSIAPRIAPQGDDDDTASSKSGGRTSLWQSVRFGGRRNSDNDDESSRTRSSILAKGHHAWGRLTGAFRGTKGNDGSTPATFRTNPPESTVATGEYSVPGAYRATDDVTSDLSNPVIRSLKWGADYLAGAGSAIYPRYTKDAAPTTVSITPTVEEPASRVRAITRGWKSGLSTAFHKRFGDDTTAHHTSMVTTEPPPTAAYELGRNSMADLLDGAATLVTSVRDWYSGSPSPAQESVEIAPTTAYTSPKTMSISTTIPNIPAVPIIPTVTRASIRPTAPRATRLHPRDTLPSVTRSVADVTTVTTRETLSPATSRGKPHAFSRFMSSVRSQIDAAHKHEWDRRTNNDVPIQSAGSEATETGGFHWPHWSHSAITEQRRRDRLDAEASYYY